MTEVQVRKTPLDVAESMVRSAYFPFDQRQEFEERVVQAILDQDYDGARVLIDMMQVLIDEIKQLAKNYENEGIDYKLARKLAHEMRAKRLAQANRLATSPTISPTRTVRLAGKRIHSTRTTTYWR